MVPEQKVDSDEPVIDEIKDIRKQVYVLYTAGHTFRVDRPLYEATTKIARRYDTTRSWVIRLALRRFIEKWEAQSGERVYFPNEGKSLARSGAGGVEGDSGSR